MVVMKFGGTSVADQAAIERLIAIVRAQRQADAEQEGGDARGPVVVVSALSGATDRLLGRGRAGRRRRHRGRAEQPARPAGPSPRRGRGDRRRRAARAGGGVLDAASSAELERIVAGAGVLREVSPRWLDTIAAAGEILSSRIVAAALNTHGLPAAWVDARRAVVTDGEHTAAAPQFPETTAALMAHADPAACRAAASR